MPKIIMHDGKVHQVSYAKAAETKGYMDCLPGYEIDSIQDPVKRKKVREFIEQVVDIDTSDLRKPGHTRVGSLRSPAVKAVLNDPKLKGTGKVKFKALMAAYKGTVREVENDNTEDLQHLPPQD
jgi:hypothetical protein